MRQISSKPIWKKDQAKTPLTIETEISQHLWHANLVINSILKFIVMVG